MSMTFDARFGRIEPLKGRVVEVALFGGGVEFPDGRPEFGAVFAIPRVREDLPFLRLAEFQKGLGSLRNQFGILDRLTTHGIAHKYPELYEQRRHVGKFYFRPPGGESWCDVILRLRGVLETITREYPRERVLIVGHQPTLGQLAALLMTGEDYEWDIKKASAWWFSQREAEKQSRPAGLYRAASAGP